MCKALPCVHVKQFCSKGHDTFIIGRNASDGCNQCTRDGTRKRQAKQRTFIQEAKNSPCSDCHITYPYYVMQFDHTNPADKKYSIGKVGSTIALKSLQLEIQKCDVVCANCHAIRTYKRMIGGCNE